jgi:hypothetical protein
MVGAYNGVAEDEELPLLQGPAQAKQKRSTLFTVCPFILG